MSEAGQPEQKPDEGGLEVQGTEARGVEPRPDDAARGLYELNVRLGLPTGFKALGMREEDIGKAIEVVAAAKIRHPKPLTKEELTDVITQAYTGAPPRF